MIDANEARHMARELVMQYMGKAGPECHTDYLKLLVLLASVVSATLREYSQAEDALEQLDDVLEDIADEFRQPLEDPPARLH